jgi:hypothetical protein
MEETFILRQTGENVPTEERKGNLFFIDLKRPSTE